MVVGSRYTYWPNMYYVTYYVTSKIFIFFFNKSANKQNIKYYLRIIGIQYLRSTLFCLQYKFKWIPNWIVEVLLQNNLQ